MNLEQPKIAQKTAAGGHEIPAISARKFSRTEPHSCKEAGGSAKQGWMELEATARWLHLSDLRMPVVREHTRLHRAREPCPLLPCPSVQFTSQTLAIIHGSLTDNRQDAGSTPEAPESELTLNNQSGRFSFRLPGPTFRSIIWLKIPASLARAYAISLSSLERRPRSARPLLLPPPPLGPLARRAPINA